MTTPEIAGLCERLRVVEYSREPSDWSGIRQVTTNWHRNPDGPEAADTLERQAAEIERLRGTLGGATAALASISGLAQSATKAAVEGLKTRAALTGEDA
jgi:hypothetical protein